MTPRISRPQLGRDELHQLRWLLGGLLTVLGVMTVVYMDVDAWVLMTLTAVASIATTLWPTLPGRVPRLVHVMAFPFIAAFFALDLWLRSELLPAMVRLDMLLLLYRALVYRQRRDDLQVVVLGLFLVVVAGVLSVSLTFAVHLLVYTACALALLLVITLSDSAAAGAQAAVTGETGTPAWVAHASWPRLFRRLLAVADSRMLAVSGGLFVVVIAVSGLLFLVIPRFQLDNGMFLDRFITRKARTGFSDAIHFGDVTEIMQDTSVALHVDVSDPGQIPLTPYWRMLVLNEYRDGTFRMSSDLRERFDRARTAVRAVGVAHPRQSRGTWTFYLEAGTSRYLPLLGEYQRVRFGEAQTFRSAPTLALIALAKEPVTMTAYQVEGFDLSSRLRDEPGGAYSGWSVPSSERGSDTLPEPATLRRLVNDAAGTGEMDTATFASRVCAWLRSRHPYSLHPRIPAGGGDPLVRWAESQAPGHCELFASAFVMLARAGGYPARVVTGFRGGTWNAFSNSFTVRNSDAHAWAEIYDRASGSWLRADPLEAPAAAEAGGVETLLARRTDSSWRARMDSLRVFWYRRIVSFDQQAQVNTFRSARHAAEATARALRLRVTHALATLKSWWSAPWGATRTVTALVVLLIAAALTWGWRWLRLAVLQAWASRPSERRNDPVRREAGRWLRRLAADGGRRSVAAAGAGEPADIVLDLQRLRFGRRETWPDARTVFKRARVEASRRRREPAPTSIQL